MTNSEKNEKILEILKWKPQYVCSLEFITRYCEEDLGTCETAKTSNIKEPKECDFAELNFPPDFYAPDADPRLLLKWCEENLIEVTAHFRDGIHHWTISLYGKKNNKTRLAGTENKFFTSALADAIIEWFS